jgi:hypothetical protein
MTADSGFGAAGPRLALYLVTQALRSRDEHTGERDTMVFAACPPDADRLIAAVGGCAGVIGGWIGLRRRGEWWLYGEDAGALSVPGGTDVVVMCPVADADVVCVSLGMPAPDPSVVLARVVGGGVPELLAIAMDVVDPPSPG